MEPLDYLKILQRHWKMAAALVVTVLIAVLLLAPSKPTKVYEATHILLRQSGTTDGAEATDNPNIVALWTSSGEVPQRVADKLGHTGPVDDLINQLAVTPSLELNTVQLVATASSDDEAVLLVNTFAERDAGLPRRAQPDRAERGRRRVADLDAQILDLNSRIAAAGGEAAPEATALVEQRTGLRDQRSAAQAEADSGVAEWTSLRTATSAKQVTASSVGVSRAQALLLGAVVSVLLAFGVAIMLDRSDSRLHTKEQAERQFGLPVLAEVPLLSIRNRHRGPVYGYEHEPSLAEAYRGLRTALLLFRDRLPLEVETAELTRRSQHRQGGRVGVARQVILVTSPEAGDGKSSTAANLAMAYAESGQSVLLVNWDLWRPIPAKVFDAEDAPGVSEFLDAGNASLVHYVHPTSVPGLHLVPAGKLGHQPGRPARRRAAAARRGPRPRRRRDHRHRAAAGRERHPRARDDGRRRRARQPRRAHHQPRGRAHGRAARAPRRPDPGRRAGRRADRRVQERLLHQAAVPHRPVPGLGPGSERVGRRSRHGPRGRPRRAARRGRARRRTRRRRGRLRPARVVRTPSVAGLAAMSPRRRRSGP